MGPNPYRVELMKRSTLLVLAGLTGLLPGQTSGQEPNACPAETAAAHRGVRFFVSAPTHADTRQRYRLPTMDSAQVRLLTDAGDAETCRRLHRFVATRRRAPGAPETPRVRQLPTFYEAGGFYYVYLDLESRRPSNMQPGQIYVDMRWRSMFVTDRDFNQVAAIAM